ncbi:MFS transporter [Singulisphaera acidiphila]|uniref:Arabinose efflux permease family protein n=1 Tax=Singulisphaera acidiphila (strain ATCC BAA-1392 / DSM 18658 / VKM B-2454 / MOB10) TaxID=886293 RepID=L0DDW4_SINAD|nr:tetracycline resistance MFS efflux pump [Singulisphaera acidiphila]AGA27569.1 arabinose efflux permease family protein [Singulisphaera acidiphila DSM 18658]
MSPLGVVVTIVLIDLLGFSIVMPLLAPFAKQYGFSGGQIGLLFAAYPMCQLVAGPILGRLSDRYGRRPVLIVSQAGTALSFLILGLSSNFTVMLLARMLDGASGGNILVAQAYVADVTKPENRARGMGLIGMAFGLGFVLGPLMGGLLLELPVDPALRLRIPFLVAAAFSTLAWVLVFTRLPESLPQDTQARQAARVVSWRGIVDTMTLPGVGRLVVLGSLVVLAFAALEGTFSLFLRERFHWEARGAAFGFSFLGLVSALVQGGFIRRLVPKYGEPRLIVVGVATVGLGFVALALAESVPALLGATLIVGVGQGLASPTVTGLLSRITPNREQGAVFGVLSSAQTLARMANYVVANLLLARSGPASPFWEAAAISAVALLLALTAARSHRPNQELGEPLAVGNEQANA